VNSTDEDRNVTVRQNGTDGEDMDVIDGEGLVRLALQEIAPDTACDVQTNPTGTTENST
jgi:hypothetical protein